MWMADATRDPDDGPFDEARDTPDAHWIKRLRDKPGAREVYRLCVFLLGLAFIALGIALAVLPGPLTIPPVLLGLYIWSKEFRFAEKLFDGFQEKARDAWEHAKAKPKSSAALTLLGLLAAAAAFWAVGHFELVDKAKDAVGI
jgi:uncharacterized membrane protein YbaN (DUF454 family)